MASQLSFFFLTLFLSLFTSQSHPTPNCAAVTHRGSALQIFHIHSPCSPFRPKNLPSWEQTILNSHSKDQSRFHYLNSLTAGRSVVPIASGRQQLIQTPTYVVKAKIGTPPQIFIMAVDTTTDATWVPFPSSQQSSSFKILGCQTAQCKQVTNAVCNSGSCGFNLIYGGSTMAANLSQDTFKLAADNITGYTFGCIPKAAAVAPQGILGLGRGPLSLVSQSRDLYQSTFSYCLPSYKALNFSGSLKLGPVAQPIRIKYTPLLKNPRRSSLYYVNLVAIRVGRRIVDIPADAFAFNPITGAGTVVDSGTVFTRLVQPAYDAVKNEFRRRMKPATFTSLGGFDTCYTVPITIPTITFMFAGANVTLPQDNFLIHSSSSSITCLAMAASPANVNSVLNVIASFQQQNHRYLFEIHNNRLGISRENCS